MVRPTIQKPHSTNYSRYNDTKQALLDADPNHDERRASILAAFQSWSGEHIAIPHQFKWVVIDQDWILQVMGTFYKDDPRTFLSDKDLEGLTVGNLNELSQT